LPLFLEMVRQLGQSEPDVARAALQGLTAYEQAPRDEKPAGRPVAARHGPASLRDIGASGPPLILVPSLINPPSVLDLDPEVSLGEAVARMGWRTLLLDWGPARDRADLDVSGHVEQLLAPLIASLEERPALVGYCLGGTMAIAAANLVPTERLVTLAAPWRFSGYPDRGRDALRELWRQSRSAAQGLGSMPMEVLQAAFWSLDPRRTVAKFAHFSELPPDSREARRFVALEDWANEGEPLPLPAARELIEDFFGEDLPGRGEWTIAGKTISEQLAVPALHCTASHDRITPAETAPAGERRSIPAGHVGMVVGSARATLHSALKGFLTPCR